MNKSQIPDDKFSVMLQYLEGLRGGARETTVQKALALIEESGQTPEDKSAQQRAQRAREVIQLLSWEEEKEQQEEQQHRKRQKHWTDWETSGCTLVTDI